MGPVVLGVGIVEYITFGEAWRVGVGPRDARVRSKSLGRVASFHRGGGISGGGDSDCGWGVGARAGGGWEGLTEGG